MALLLLVLSTAWPLAAQSDDEFFPEKPEPAVYVHDYAGWLTPDEKTRLEQKLVAYHDSTSTQIVVMIRPDIGDYDKATYAFELGNRWGIGRKSKDNGVVMLVKTVPPDRGIFIATGYGTEGALPDAAAGRIIREVMAPYFRQEQYFQGIDAGTSSIISALAGEFEAEGEAGEPLPGWVGFLIFLGIFGLIIFIAWKARHSTMYDHSGPRSRGGGGGWGGWIGGGGGGGWGGGGGGWGGGGGGSFGGGGFGGGGAGGDW